MQTIRFWKVLLLLTISLLLVSCARGDVSDADSEETPLASASEGTPTAAEDTPASTATPVAARTSSPTPLPPQATDTLTPSATAMAPASATATAIPEPTASNTPSAPTPTAVPDSPSSTTGAIVVDHTSVDDFERIPDEYLQAAADLRMVYIDASVGKNIDDALNCLSRPSEAAAPNHCVRTEHIYPEFSVDPAVVSWSRPGGYDRSNWAFRSWEGSGCSGWEGKVSCFFQMIEPVIEQYDVVSYQFSYLEVDDDSTIADQPGGFFSDNPDRQDVYDLEAFAAQYPDTTFIYWTTSLARIIGTPVSETFNEQMRQYAIENGKPLFDVADILSHDPDGNPCYDSRDGVPYDNGNQSENYPDDGADIPAICPHYTTEVDGGHLGRVSAGKIRAAKAFWVLMARIAGWSGE